MVEWLAEAGERARADGLILMIEPEPICWCDSGRATAALIARASSAALKINYDPGNVAWLENRDPLDEFSAVAPLIANVHMKDLRPLTRGAGFPEWVPAGDGMIDYAAHFRALHASRVRRPGVAGAAHGLQRGGHAPMQGSGREIGISRTSMISTCQGKTHFSRRPSEGI